MRLPGPRWRTCVVSVELDAVRFTLKRVVNGRVVVLVRVHQRHTVRSTHCIHNYPLGTESHNTFDRRTLTNLGHAVK